VIGLRPPIDTAVVDALPCVVCGAPTLRRVEVSPGRDTVLVAACVKHGTARDRDEIYDTVVQRGYALASSAVTMRLAEPPPLGIVFFDVVGVLTTPGFVRERMKRRMLTSRLQHVVQRAMAQRLERLSVQARAHLVLASPWTHTTWPDTTTAGVNQAMRSFGVRRGVLATTRQHEADAGLSLGDGVLVWLHRHPAVRRYVVVVGPDADVTPLPLHKVVRTTLTPQGHGGLVQETVAAALKIMTQG
jgi:hypothetical protein